MSKIKIIISEFNNANYVFEYSEGTCNAIYRLTDSPYRVGTMLVGRIKDVKNDLKCCFVEMGQGNIGYLSFDDCNPSALLNKQYDGRYIQGDEILVRIIRMPGKNKPFSLSMHAEVAGKYSVVSTKGNGFFASSKLNRSDKEKLLSDVSKTFDNQAFKELACLLRTDSITASMDELVSEIKSNKDELEKILAISDKRKLYSIVYEPQADYVSRILNNDYEDIEEVLTDNSEIYETLLKTCLSEKLSFYKDTEIPLRILFNLDRSFSDAVSRKVYLNCGGYLVIDPTEALTVIDVNSGKYTGKRNNSDTISLVNREAADMIALQLKLRNISGIVIIDFINCSKEEEDNLVSYMRSLVKKDKVKTVIEGFTRLGLMEITRQKIYPSIYEK